MGVLKTKVVINSVTVKDDDGAPDPGLLFNWEFERSTESGIASLVITSPQTIDDTLTLVVGQTVVVTDGFTTSTDKKEFDGFISAFKPEGGVIKIECKDKMWDLVRKNVNKIYQDSGAQAGQISEIAKDLIETHGGMTANVQATGTLAGETIKEFRCVHTDIYERLMTLAQAVNYQVWYDPIADEVHFEPRGFNASGVTVTTGIDILGVPVWNYDTSQMVNDLRIDGASVESQLRLPTDTGANGIIDTTTNFDTTGITLPKTPESVQLIIDASNPPTTVVEGGGEDSSTSAFYFIDKENKQVKPATGTTFTVGHRAIVNYTWFAPAPIHMENADSKTLYGNFEKEITLSDVVTIADAEARATEILNRFSNPFTIGDILLKRVSTLSVKVGDTVTVVDNVNKPNVNAEFVITREVLKYPGSNQEITVGDEPLILAGWQMDVEERLKRLEEQNIKNDDLLLELINIQNSLPNVPRYIKVLTETMNLTTNFVLGHPDMGVLGTDVLGRQADASTNHFVQQYQNSYTEDFIDADFKDTTNTTATWTTTGSVTYAAGSESDKETHTGEDDQAAAFGVNWFAQTFTVGNVGSNVNFSATKAILRLRRQGLASGNVTVSLRATDTSGFPTGADIASVTVTFSSLPTGFTDTTFTFDTPVLLRKGVTYALVLSYPDGGGGPSGQVQWRFDGTSPTYTGGSYASSTDSGSVWTLDTDNDFYFTIQGIEAQIAQSESVDFNNSTITAATLTSTEVSGAFTYEMTADGTNWESVTSGTAKTFTNSGTDLRWRAVENVGSTGEISKITITNYHT